MDEVDELSKDYRLLVFLYPWSCRRRVSINLDLSVFS